MFVAVIAHVEMTALVVGVHHRNFDHGLRRLLSVRSAIRLRANFGVKHSRRWPSDDPAAELPACGSRKSGKPRIL